VSILSVMTDITACLIAQFETDGRPPFCFAGLLPGDAIAHDYTKSCDDADGMLWVRFASGYPATAVGLQDDSTNNCAKSLGYDLEVGFLRGAPLPDDQGNPPTVEEQQASVEQQLADMLTARKALKCCVPLKSMEYRLGGFQPFGPMGGVVGGLWALSVAQ
jgi:hypothetical protein